MGIIWEYIGKYLRHVDNGTKTTTKAAPATAQCSQLGFFPDRPSSTPVLMQIFIQY